MSAMIKFDFEPPVALLTLNRPEKLNALTDSMLDQALKLCRDIERNSAVRGLIIMGAGDRSFCAGGDIGAWSDLEGSAFARHWVRDGHSALDALATLLQPVVAVLNGDVLGGGLEMAAVADYRIAESHIRLGQPETLLGIIPGWSGTQRTVRRFGSSVVKRMALFGETFSAEEALQLGIVDRVVEKGHGLNEARSLIDSLSTRSPVATELTKQLINASEGEERERVLEALASYVAANSKGLQIGLSAFRRKSIADFRDTVD